MKVILADELPDEREERQGITIEAIIEELRQEGERDAIAIIERFAANAPTSGERKGETFEEWVERYRRGKPYWSTSRMEICRDAWQASRATAQPQAAEPKGLTNEQRDNWMNNAGYQVFSKISHVGTAWDFVFPGKTGMDNRHYRSEAVAREAAIAHFEEAVNRARALLANGE